MYEKLPNKGITLFHCLAHARRKIFDAQSNDKARSEYVLNEMRKLYAIEESCMEQQFKIDQIKAIRQKEAIPILKSLGEWMTKEYTRP